jgi:hypothetical protein
LKDQAIEMEWQDDYEIARYTYISQLLALTKQRNDIELREEEARKRREQMFPTSFEDFKGKGKDIQLRAARFLVADSVKQEKMMTEFNWAWRQVQPLKDVFSKDSDVSNFFLSLMTPPPIFKCCFSKYSRGMYVQWSLQRNL